ncbi:MAG TPA: STAS/SEC14 domain-containing protein [Longimicrobium sp.]|nr:STAS/SEC14 domain-containing protein [Longimicrobium sp.]
MSFTYEIDAERELVTVRVSGNIRTADLAVVREGVMADPAFRPNFKALLDMREADFRGINLAELRERAGRPPEFRCMAILALPGFPYGIARMYEMCTPLEVAVFTEREAALAWLRQCA